MQKSIPVWFAAIAGSLSLGAFPLEWNVNNKTNVPYEVEIIRTKLEKLAGVEKNCGFEVTADTPEGKKKLDVTLLKGKLEHSVALRFSVPEGTTALDCQPVSGASIANADEINLFAGAVTNASAWKIYNGGTIKAADGKLIFSAKKFGFTTFTFTADVPENLAGSGAKLEFDFKSTAPEVWSSNIRVEQLDANGNVLSESLTDPRWITLMRPPQVLTQHRESGRIHPDAKKLRFSVRASGVQHEIGADGMPAKNPKVFLPQFEISHLAVRAAEELPFPKYRDEFFAPGVSGKPGDFAFDATKGEMGKAFFFATHSQAGWAEGKTITSQKEVFYPHCDGTVETWVKPEWKRSDKRTTFYYIFTAEPTQFVGPMADKNVKVEPCLGLKYFPKTKKAVVEFKDYTTKIYKKEFPCEITSKKWNHVAVQWSKDGGFQTYINGKKVFDDPQFTFTPVDYTDKNILSAKDRYTPIANEYIPSQVSLGNNRYSARSGTKHANLRAQFDLFRISSAVRYKDDFTPARNFTVDDDTRALFDFNRSFDGISGGGARFISGSNWSEVSRRDNQIEVNGKVIDYFPATILDSNHPAKVLNKSNYTRVPNAKDFLAARKSEKIVFDFKGNATKEIKLDEPVYMDYIEYKNTGSTTAVHPFVRKDCEIDPRSFADIRNSMNIAGSTPRERTNRIFQFMLASSDYYASHQLYFEPGTDAPDNACYKALIMLNSYCGFECGPLNNMTANMFACSGAIPASQTGGFGHSFQQAWVDGKSNLYDLSAQKFFPSMDNETPAGLGETALEPGIFNRVGGNSDHFIRVGTRRYDAQTPAYIERVSMSLRPGETLRMWFINNGRFNNLLYNRSFYKKSDKKLTDMSKIVHAKGKGAIVEKRRIFPDYGSTFLYFNDAPAKFAKNFTNVKADSFCYKVFTCFPIVYAEYAAKLNDGSFAKLEISTDRGKTFRELKLDKDGTARPYYQVCARREYLIRVNAPLKNVANFNAMTQMITNPRVMTCKLAKGENRLLYTEQNGTDVKVTLQYRKYAKDIDIAGEVIRTGSERGFERIATVLAPGESKCFDIKGISGKAKVKSTGKLKAKLAGNKLTISVPAGNIKSIEAATIVDDGAEKQLVVLIHPGIELVTAKNITPVKQAELVTNEIQQAVNLSGKNAQVKVNLAKKRPAGTYSIWNCVRYSNQQLWTRVNLKLPQGGKQEVFRHMNSASEFLKSKFFGENGRGKFFWTFPNKHYYDCIPHKLGKPFDSLNYQVVISNEKYIELAGTIILPDPSAQYFDEMVKTLCGINHNKWYVDEVNAKQ